MLAQAEGSRGRRVRTLPLVPGRAGGGGKAASGLPLGCRGVLGAPPAPVPHLLPAAAEAVASALAASWGPWTAAERGACRGAGLRVWLLPLLVKRPVQTAGAVPSKAKAWPSLGAFFPAFQSQTSLFRLGARRGLCACCSPPPFLCTLPVRKLLVSGYPR